MITDSRDALPDRKGDFWKFWTGQAISSLGSSFTTFALPLLVFKLTGSAINLGLAYGAEMLPYLIFGLVIGALVDRVNRKHLMIITDLLRACVIALLPLLLLTRFASIWWVYVAAFLSSALSIGFDAAAFAAIPNLVQRDDLVKANGRIQASYSLMSMMGPLLAALLLIVSPLPTLLWYDAVSFLISAGTLKWIKTSFNASLSEVGKRTSLQNDIIEGLQYILTHPLLRWLILLLFFTNLVVSAIFVQFVLFAKQVLMVSDSQLGILYSFASIGVVFFSLGASWLSRRWSFSVIGLGAIRILGILTIVLAFTRLYLVSLPLWAGISGVVDLFNINASSLAQAIIPDDLLGRIASFVKVLSWSISPIGALLGGFMIERTKNAPLVYGWLGGLTVLISILFIWTPLGHLKLSDSMSQQKDENGLK